MHPAASSLPENFDHSAVFRVQPVFLLVGNLAGKDRMKSVESQSCLFLFGPICMYSKHQTDEEEVQLRYIYIYTHTHIYIYIYSETQR